MTACLGVPSAYRAQIVARPFNGRPAEIVDDFGSVVACAWSRERNAVTKATVEIPLTAECCARIGWLTGMASLALFELHLYRDPGGLVWAGPIDSISEDPSLSADVDTVTIAATGPLGWAQRRVFAAPMPYTPGGPGQAIWVNTDLTTIFVDWFNYLMSKDDPYIGVTSALSGVISSQSVSWTEPEPGWERLQTLIEAGVDVTEYGRTILVGGLEQLTPRLATVTEEWFADPAATEADGTGQATKVWVIGAAGIVGSAGGPDPATGLVIETVLTDSQLSTVAQANTYAARVLNERKQTDLIVSGTNELSATAQVDINELIPGSRAAVDLNARCVVAYDEMVLTKVDVAYSVADGDTDQDEKVTVTFEPDVTS